MTGKKKGIENLKPNSERTPEERKELAAKAGRASGEARREKKLMSKIYSEFLAEEYDVKIEGNVQKMSGAKMVSYVMRKVLNRGDSATVALMREIREGTEGSKTKVDIEMPDEVVDEIKKLFGVTLKEHADK